MRVTILKPGVFTEFGISAPVGTTIEVGNDYGKSLVASLQASDTDGILSAPQNAPFDVSAAAGLTVAQSGAGAVGVVGVKADGTLLGPNGSPVSRDSYEGFVATHMIWPNVTSTGNKQLFSRMRHVARDEIRDIKFGYTNITLAGLAGAELPSGYTTTIECSLEYPAGSAPKTMYFSGGAVGTIQPSGAILWTDSLTLATPIPRGAVFYSRTFQASASGIVYAAGRSNSKSGSVAANGETTTVGATTTNYVNSTTVPNGTSNWTGYGPSAIIGTTARPSFFVFGDSRAYGSGEAPFYGGLNQFGACGIVERAVSHYAAVCNPSIPGARAYEAAQAPSSYNVRGELPQYASHWINELGINDCGQGYTYAQLTANIAAMLAKFGNKPTFFMTLQPSTSASTDGWMTVASQTTQATGETVRVAYSKALAEGGVAWPCCGVIDERSIFESARYSGKFKAATRTFTDGAMTSGSNILTSATANFQPDDLGCGITVLGAGVAGAALVGYVSAVTNSTTVTIGSASFAAVNASTTVSGATCGFPATVDGVHTSTFVNRDLELHPCWAPIVGLCG